MEYARWEDECMLQDRLGLWWKISIIVCICTHSGQKNDRRDDYRRCLLWMYSIT